MQGCGGLSGSQGRWTDEEHDKFLEGMRLFGKDWRRIEEEREKREERDFLLT